MRLQYILSICFIFSILSCIHSQKLTIAFTDISSLGSRAKVYNMGRHIGYVKDIKANKTVDTLFVTIKLLNNCKIPKGSFFYLDEYFIGPSRITVEYSKQNAFMTSKDIPIGISRPFKPMTSSQIDTSKREKLGQPTRDSAKHN